MVESEADRVSIPSRPKGDAGPIVSVAMGQWAVAAPPTLLRTLLGSCVGVVLYEKQTRIGGVAHIVLPDSRGSAEAPGKYADTAIPGLVEAMEKLAGRRLRPRITAKLLGCASMFQASGPMEIGRLNREAAERLLAGLGVPVVGCDLGGDAGRRLTFDTQTGIVTVKIPGRADYDL